MTITPARQRNAASEGMALGLMLLGYDAVTYDKLRVDLAFGSAWRNWSYRSRFPQVSTDLRQGLDAVYAMTRASESKHVWVLYWDRDGKQLRIYTRQDDWDPKDEGDVDYALSVIAGDVPRAGWTSLAQAFVEKMAR